MDNVPADSLVALRVVNSTGEPMIDRDEEIFATPTLELEQSVGLKLFAQQLGLTWKQIFTTSTSELERSYDLASFAQLLGLTGKQLAYLLYKRDITKKYNKFEIEKKNGGIRVIKSPNEQLKFLQRNVTRELNKLRDFKPFVTGFVSKRSVLDNALFHVAKRHVLNIDLEDFFGSINFGRVFGLLSKPPYKIERHVAAAIAKLATHENSLPQGAPTSPVLANLICTKLDSEIARLCRQNKCTYSRYADDITISSQMKNFPLAHLDKDGAGPSSAILSPELISIIKANGFEINVKKTRLYPKEWRQEVTGLVVNEKPNVRRSYIRNIRATLHAIEKFGPDGAQREFEKKFGGKVDLSYRLAGQISFVGQIRGRNDDLYKKLVARFNSAKLSIKLRSNLTPQELAESSVWVLEGDTKDGKDTDQGTAFFIEKFGLVTCQHCIKDSMYIYHSRTAQKRFPVTVEKIDNDLDLAILSIPEELKGIERLKIGSISQLKNQDKIWLMGYPNHEKWKPIRSEAGTFVRSFPTSARQYLEITPKIIGGNSGGPITDQNFAVIGIAQRGVTLDTSIKEAEYVGISVHELSVFSQK